jgi:hypothetical protein
VFDDLALTGANCRGFVKSTLRFGKKLAHRCDSAAVYSPPIQRPAF